MIIYNVTVNITNDVKDDWLIWMKEVYFPDVMETKCIIATDIFKVLVDEEEGTTYSVQLSCNTMEDYNNYQINFSHKMKKVDSKKYANKMAAFSTLLEKI
jgi:hypothetical protein